MGMYQPEIETMDRNELEKLQLERLQKQIKNVYENVPMYRERMDKKGVKPEDIKELKDLAKLPFTTKQDLRDYYPFELFAADKKDIVRTDIVSLMPVIKCFEVNLQLLFIHSKAIVLYLYHTPSAA